MEIPKAEPKEKRFKILLIGEHGTYKTRVMLRLSQREGEPALAVIDTEGGTDHYADEFDFRRIQSSDADEISKVVSKVAESPGPLTCIGVDSISVYSEAVQSKYVDLFMKREIGTSGHKRDYYTLQPRDYQHIHREITRVVKNLVASDLHVIATCQTKDLWQSDFKVVGKTFDGFKRLPYYFDIVLFIAEDTDGKLIARVQKDRTNHLPKTIPWSNDKVAVEHLSQYIDLISGEARPVATTDDPSIEATDTNVTKSQLDEIVKLKKQLGIEKKEWTELLGKYGVATAKDFTNAQAAQFIEKLNELDPTQDQSGS